MPESTSPTLPPDIQVTPGDNAGLRIRAHVLRATLEMDQEQAEIALPLVKLLTLLAELANHVSEMETFLNAVWPAWNQFSHKSTVHEPSAGAVSLLKEMRAVLLDEAPHRLRTALIRQRRAAKLCLVFQSAMKAASVDFAREIAAEFNPTVISSAVRAGQPHARAEQFWQRFEQQADRFTASEVERRFTHRFVLAVERLYPDPIP